MKFITSPSVFLLSRQVMTEEGLKHFLQSRGMDSWNSDSEIPSEVITETAGRICYMSFMNPRPGGNSKYLEHIKETGHGSVLEHAVWTFVFSNVSRSLTHELVRHRAGMAYSQLSQRYVDESEANYVVPEDLKAEVDAFFLVQKYGTASREVREFAEKHGLDTRDELVRMVGIGEVWTDAIEGSHTAYELISNYLSNKFRKVSWMHRRGNPKEFKTEDRKRARQAARSILPNATETIIEVTMNARSARHFIEQRGSRFADSEIRSLAYEVLKILQVESPNIFGDYYAELDINGNPNQIFTKYNKV